MSSKEIIAKIKAEIERLYNGEAPKHDQQCNFDDGYFVGIDTIAQFLDSLESEKPMNQEGLEKEIDRVWKQCNPIDEEMCTHYDCEHFCGTPEQTDAVCWQRYFDLKERRRNE